MPLPVTAVVERGTDSSERTTSSRTKGRAAMATQKKSRVKREKGLKAGVFLPKRWKRTERKEEGWGKNPNRLVTAALGVTERGEGNWARKVTARTQKMTQLARLEREARWDMATRRSSGT